MDASRWRQSWSLIALLVGLAGLSAGPVAADDLADVEAAVGALVEATNAGDGEAVIGHYLPEPTIFFGGGGGRVAWDVEMVKGWYDAGFRTDWALSDLDVQIVGGGSSEYGLPGWRVRVRQWDAGCGLGSHEPGMGQTGR